MDWERIQSEIEDLLFPQRDLDVWERVVYYNLLRQTRTIGIEQALVAIQPLSVTLRVGHRRVRWRGSLGRRNLVSNPSRAIRRLQRRQEVRVELALRHAT